MSRQTTKTPPVDRTKVAENPVKPGQIVETSQATQKWRETLGQMQPQLLAAMQQSTMRPETIMQHAINAMKFSSKLFECTSYSVMGCMMKACTLGLSLDPTLGEAYMIPFNNRNTGKMEAQFIPGYKGLLKRIIRTGKVKVPRTLIVYEGDYFDYTADPFPSYKYMPFELAVQKGLTKWTEKGRIWCAVFIAEHTESAHPVIEIMFKAELDKIRARSLSKTGGPWVTDEAEMCRKSVARRGCKWLSMDDPDTQEAIALDEQAELQIPQGMAQLALGDDIAYGQAQEHAAEEVKKQEEAQAPAPAELPADDALKQAMMEKINARVNEMRGENLSWEEFDKWIDALSKQFKVDADVMQWPLEALNVLWEKIKPAEREPGQEG